TALGPVFAAGFAVQQFLEILTSFLDLDSRPAFQKYKKPILGTVALALGYALANSLNMGVLQILKGVDPTKPAPVGGLDLFVTALVISAGTEGVNSILKFLKYSKEDKKRDAAAADPKSVPPGAPPPALAPQAAVAAHLNGASPAATEDALARINRQ
ncbi:MAG: hypothetical protein M3348_15215, partial [Acidobacteriota bacterium]|nr:hypothetical protein [Acidobacteriota bacterium]